MHPDILIIPSSILRVPSLNHVGCFLLQISPPSTELSGHRQGGKNSEEGTDRAKLHGTAMTVTKLCTGLCSIMIHVTLRRGRRWGLQLWAPTCCCPAATEMREGACPEGEKGRAQRARRGVPRRSQPGAERIWISGPSRWSFRLGHVVGRFSFPLRL